MAKVLVAIAIAISVSGCALIAAGFIGAGVEEEHQQWCASHRMESNCWAYYSRRGSHVRYH